MTADQTFVNFVTRVLEKDRARRFISLAETKNGRAKILDALCHHFEDAILPQTIHSRNYDPFWKKPCFAYYQPLGFGVEFETLRRAYDELSTTDSWLIILTDRSAGIYRPESRWDDEKLIIP